MPRMIFRDYDGFGYAGELVRCDVHDYAADLQPGVGFAVVAF
jgi:hypothetical protein